MLASRLIQKFVSTSAFLRAYCDAYGGDPSTLPASSAQPPSRGHAENMGKTLLEWSGRLDAAGIQVHQEGAIARFHAASLADDHGRPPPAAAARKKTAAFYEECLRRAVRMSDARSYEIPAASHQGAIVASHEALAAANDYRGAAKTHAEFTADPSRPELIEEGKKIAAQAGRAASMHATACAEAIAAWRIADQGPWFRVVQKPEDVPVGPFVVGVEVWANSPVLPRLHANLDPQHGGGTYGLGGQPFGAKAACDAALIFRSVFPALPESTRYVTTRLDPDALLAAMILSGRVPLSLLGLVSRGRRALEELAFIDSSESRPGGWTQEIRVQSVGDDPTWGPVGALMIPGRVASLDVLEGAVLSALTGAEPGSEHAAAIEAHRAQWARVPELARRFDVDGPIAFAADLPVGAGTWAACYTRAPIGVLSFVRPGTADRAFTVAACRDLGKIGQEFVAEFNRAMNDSEPGTWAGAAGITGSRRPTTHSLATVVAAARRIATRLGIRGTESSAAANGVLPALR